MAVPQELYEWAGWGMVALGGAVALFGFVADRSRGRRRCPRCFYDMSAAAKGESGKWICPECGKTVPHEKQLLRTRPRRGVIALGVLIALLCNALFAVPRISAAGLIGAVPTTLLAPATPWYGADFAGGWRLDLTVELKRRVADGQVHAVAAYLWGWRSRLSLSLTKNRDAEMTCSTYDTEQIAEACGMDGTVLERSNAIQAAVTGLIDPENWADNGGTRSQIFGVGRVMATDTTAKNDRAVRELLDALRGDVSGVERWRPVGGALGDIATLNRLRSTIIRPPDQPLRLADVAALVESESGLRIRVFTEEIEEAPVFLATPLALGVSSRSADELLDTAIARLWGGRNDLVGWCVADGAIHVRRVENMGTNWRRAVVYDVSDFVKRAACASTQKYRKHCGLEPDPTEDELRDWARLQRQEFSQEVLSLVEEAVDPDGWVQNGGDRFFACALGDRLVIQGPVRAHVAIAKFLERLRAGPVARLP